MDNASNKGLYTLIAIVVFGIFISLSYWLFQDQMKSVLGDVMFNTGEMADTVLSPDYYGDNYFAKPTGSENFRYDIVGGEVRLASYTGTSKDVVVPYELDGYPVTSIESTIFYNKGLNTLILPNTIKTIGIWAFNTNRLTTLTLPNSLTSIGTYSFARNQLTSVTIPQSVTSIGSYAFANNPLTSARVPTSTVIQSNAFPDTTVITRY